VAACALLTAGVAAGCGGDDEPEKKGTSSREDAPAAACETDVVATYADGSEVDLDHTAALDVGAGAAYTVYAADFDVADVSPVSGVVPEEDGHLATLAVTTFNAEGEPEKVTQGSTIEWTEEFGVLTFSVVLNRGATALGSTAGAAGTVDVVAVDDESLCLDVDYRDDEKLLVGTIAADLS